VANKDYLMDERDASNLVDVEPTSKMNPPAPPVPHAIPTFFSGSIPPQVQHDTSFVATKPGSSRIPTHALMPLGVQGNPGTNAGIQSTTTKIIQQTGNSGPLLETNDIPNSNQQVLNLSQGANITIAPDAQGRTIISASGGSNKIDLHDHFIFGNVTDLTGAFIGELGWSAQNGPTSGLSKTLCMGGFPNLGQVQLFPSLTTANSGGSMVPSSTWGSNRTNPGDSNSDLSSRWPLLDYPGWTATWVFRIVRPNIRSAEQTPIAFDKTKLSLYVGFANGGTATPPMQFSQRPNVFYGVRFDTDSTSPSIGDTTFHLEACQNAINSQVVTRFNAVGTNGGNFDTTIAPSEDIFYTLQMSYLMSGSLVMTFTDGTTTSSTTFTLTPLSMSGLNNGGFGITKNQGLVFLPCGPAAFTSSAGCFGFGTKSKATISGMTGGFAVYNGTKLILDTDEGNTGALAIYFKDPTGGSVGNPGTFTMSGYSALVPFVGISNDTTGGAAVGSRSVAVDEFHFIWN
jgi:hypothetical protein